MAVSAQTLRMLTQRPRRPDVARDLAPFEPSASRPWNRRRAAHLMRRAGFGGRPEEIDAVVALGMNRTVDILLSVSTSGLQTSGTQVLPNGEVLNLTSEVDSQRAQWLWEMCNGQYPLREKMTLFWHDHFSVGAGAQQAVALLPQHINVLRTRALGSFRDMLIAVTKDPAMLWWLDNRLNGVGGKVNENYGRELLELYTMGVAGGYTQNDVYEASRCLSGWTLDGFDIYRYDPLLHLPGDKVVLGKTIPSAGEAEVYDLIDRVVLPWPKTADYIVTKLWAWFVSPDPYPLLIDELARRFAKSGFNILSLMDTILRCSFFHEDTTVGVLVKNPVELAVGALRNTSTPIFSFKELGKRVAGMGYPLLRYSNPSGLEEGLAWMTSSTVFARANFANEITQLSTTGGIQNRFDPWKEITRAGLTTAEQIVDHYLTLLVDDRVPDQVRWAYYDFMHRTDAGYEPFTLAPAKVIQKVRGLVHLIVSLPEYQIN